MPVSSRFNSVYIQVLEADEVNCPTEIVRCGRLDSVVSWPMVAIPKARLLFGLSQRIVTGLPHMGNGMHALTMELSSVVIEHRRPDILVDRPGHAEDVGNHKKEYPALAPNWPGYSGHRIVQ